MKNTLALKIIICTLAIFIDARSCLAQHFTDLAKPQLDQAVNELTPVTLSAGLKFDKKAEPLDPLLLPGNLFDKKVAEALLRTSVTQKDQWYTVPSWHTGTWVSKQVNQTRGVFYRNGVVVEGKPAGVYQSISKQNCGLLKDRNGAIWDRRDCDSWSEQEEEQGVLFTYFITESSDEGANPCSYSERVSFLVAPKTNLIKSVYRSKGWDKTTLLAPGIAKIETVQTIFSDSGFPDQTCWGVCVDRRVNTFESYENTIENRKALEVNFREFCHSKGLGDLLPIKPATITPAVKRPPVVKAKTRH